MARIVTGFGAIPFVVTFLVFILLPLVLPVVDQLVLVIAQAEEGPGGLGGMGFRPQNALASPQQ